MPRTEPDTILTLAEFARRNRRVNAVDDLRELGIEVRPDCTLTAEQIEALAKVASTFTEQEG
jgi:hypothetical protein